MLFLVRVYVPDDDLFQGITPGESIFVYMGI